MCITFGVRVYFEKGKCEYKHVFYLILLGYESLQHRKESREAAWRSPGWDECVAYTVPLIKDMHCRILSPTEFSPTQ